MFISLYSQEQWEHLRLPEINILVLTGTVLTVSGLLRSMFLLGAGGCFWARTSCPTFWRCLWAGASTQGEFCLNTSLGFEAFPGYSLLYSLLEVLLISWLGELFYCLEPRLSHCLFLQSEYSFHVALFLFFKWNCFLFLNFLSCFRLVPSVLTEGRILFSYRAVCCGLQHPLASQIFCFGRYITHIKALKAEEKETKMDL